MSAIRSWALFTATLAWLWASSVFTPWAEDRAARLWLYDTLFYVRHVLMFWAAAEIALLAFRRREGRARIAFAPLMATAGTVLAAWIYADSQPGIRWRVAASRHELSMAAHAGASNQRLRAGHFLLDSVREPCAGQTWLWLGRPHGGGTGTNVALVQTESPPLAPSTQAFAFWEAGHGWWVAYQHAGHYQHEFARGGAPTCGPGRILPRHGAGRAWVEQGRRALERN